MQADPLTLGQHAAYARLQTDDLRKLKAKARGAARQAISLELVKRATAVRR